MLSSQPGSPCWVFLGLGESWSSNRSTAQIFLELKAIAALLHFFLFLLGVKTQIGECSSAWKYLLICLTRHDFPAFPHVLIGVDNTAVLWKAKKKKMVSG